MGDDQDRLADLGRIAGSLVHELKNPLGVMLLNAELLEGQLEQIVDPVARERAGKRLSRIRESGRSLQSIVQSFLAFARPNRPDPVAVDVNAVLQQLIEEQAEPNRLDEVAVVFRPDPRLALVPADDLHLASAFRNILVNAREALRGHEPVHGNRHILVVTRAAPQRVRVVIANNGPALSQSVAARLFEPFISDKVGGTGLGLAIVRRLVELHHGTVAVASDPDQGVSFTFEFPTPLGPAQSPIAISASEPTNGAKRLHSFETIKQAGSSVRRKTNSKSRKHR